MTLLYPCVVRGVVSPCLVNRKRATKSAFQRLYVSLSAAGRLRQAVAGVCLFEYVLGSKCAGHTNELVRVADKRIRRLVQAI